MNLDEMAVRVQPGDGLLTRFPAAVIAITKMSQGRVLADQVLAVVHNAMGYGGPAGRRLARQLAALVTQADPEEVPSFCAIAQTEDGALSIFAVGDVEIQLTRADSFERLSGRDVATWLDRIVRDPFLAITVVPVGERPALDERTDLRAGTVPGAGFSLVPAATAAEPAAAPALGAVGAAAPHAVTAAEAKSPAEAKEAGRGAEPAPAPAPAPSVAILPPVEGDDEGETSGMPVDADASTPPEDERDIDFRAVLLLDPDPEEAEEVRPPLAIASETPAPPVAEAEGTIVDGVLCSRNHFNDPAGSYCSVCGISMLQRTRNLVKGVRPPLGVVVFDDGVTFALDSDYVIGRDPSQDEAVSAMDARPLVVEDPGRTVSRVHAALVLEGWEVKLVDRRSANGTFVAQPDSSEWGEAIRPFAPVAIRPGTRVRLGDQRKFLFDSPHRS